MNQQRGTRLTGDDITDIIEHVNDDHAPEMLRCVQVFSPLAEARTAVLKDLYENGMGVEVDGAEVWVQFVPTPDDAPAAPGLRLRQTVAEATRRLGLERPERVINWTLQRSERVGPMLRLHLASDEAPNDWRPSFACRWDIAGEEHGRYYTIRSVSEGGASVDVYVHDGAGARWAEGLQAGATVVSRGEYREKFPDFSVGASALLGDETALPTIAALLEHWTAQAPHVLLEVDDAAAAGRYFSGVPHTSRLQLLPKGETPLEHAEAALLSLLENADLRAVWGAGEAKAATRLRRRLRVDHLELKSRVVGYWRQ